MNESRNYEIDSFAWALGSDRTGGAFNLVRPHAERCSSAVQGIAALFALFLFAFALLSLGFATKSARVGSIIHALHQLSGGSVTREKSLWQVSQEPLELILVAAQNNARERGQRDRLL